VYFVSPYFYRDAFMHHTMHVLDAFDVIYHISDKIESMTKKGRQKIWAVKWKLFS